MKTCTICQKTSDVVSFEPQRRQCVLCRKARMKVTRKAYYARTREQSIAAVAQWRVENPEKKLVQRKKEYARNSDFAKEAARQYRKNNPDKVNAWSKNRMNAKRSSMPSWADTTKIKAYYDVCAFFNDINGYTKYHVDHVVPLQGKIVTGLHVHNNLQIILASDNRSKGNKFTTT